ncbi:MAG: hypothetical protein ABIK09_05465 [Pseudomonadota bacterium]
MSMRHRGHLLRVLSTSVSGLFFAQLLLTTLHFLALEHGAVTRDGALAHGAHVHQLPAQAGAEHRRGLLPEAAPDERPGCGLLSILLRVAVGVERPVRLSAGASDWTDRSGVTPPRKKVAPPTPLLTNAPKHSPPASC